MAHPCPFCVKYKDHFSEINKPAAERHDWKPVFPIPRDRVHFCIMHLFHRVTEKLLLRLCRAIFYQVWFSLYATLVYALLHFFVDSLHACVECIQACVAHRTPLLVAIMPYSFSGTWTR